MSAHKKYAYFVVNDSDDLEYIVSLYIFVTIKQGV